MSYFYLNEMEKTHQKIDVNYPVNEINKRHIQKKINGIANSKDNVLVPVKVEGDYIKENKIYYEIILQNKKPNFNFELLNPTSFTARRIYITGLLHSNITNMTDNDKSIIGELIIEHTPKTAVNQKVFSCYLLEITDQGENDLDSIVSYIQSNDNKDISIDINKLIDNQEKAIHYESNYDHVFVFMKTIPINSSSGSFIKKNLTTKTDLFTVSAPTKSVIINLNEHTENDSKNEENTNKNTKGSQETFIGSIFGKTIEGVTNQNDVYMECELLDESDERETAYVASKMDSTDSKKNQTIQFYQLASNFFLIIFVLVLCRLAIPPAYKYVILTGIIKWQMNVNDDTINYLKHVRMVDYLILFVIFCYSIHFLAVGMSVPGKEIFNVFFLIFCAMAVFGYSVIQLAKRDEDYMTFEFGEKIVKLIYGDSDIEIEFPELMKLPFVLMSFAVFKPMFWVIYTAFFIIYAIFAGLLKLSDATFWMIEFAVFNFVVFTPFVYASFSINKVQ
jgi:hypothetical protein